MYAAAARSPTEKIWEDPGFWELLVHGVSTPK
jgi:hypothetical protein